MDAMTQTSPMPPARRALGLGACAIFVAVALWEAALAVVAPRRAARLSDWQAAAALVRGGFQAGDLIVFAPPWSDPVGRSVLGDLMPAAMVGRPDAARYPRLWELSIRGARAAETAHLVAEWQADLPRGLRVARYAQRPLAVTYDLVERYPSARVTQMPAAAALDPADAERPCYYTGGETSAATLAGRGDPPGFRCGGAALIVRRVMEIDYQPRYGVVVPVDPGQRTRLTYADIPAEALRGATLWLWAGLHDYYARKTESGPADIAVSFAPGGSSPGAPPRRASLRVSAEGGWQRLQIPVADLLPAGEAPAPRSLRLDISAADARARNLGFAAELRR